MRPLDSSLGKENPIVMSNAFGVLELIEEEQADTVGDQISCNEGLELNKMDSIVEAAKLETLQKVPQADRDTIGFCFHISLC